MGKRKLKRLFPANMAASYIPTSRIDPNKAVAYNAQRSKATVGPRSDVEHKLNNTFMQEIPETKSPHVKYTMPYSIDEKTGKKKHHPIWQTAEVKTPRGATFIEKHELMTVTGKKGDKDTLFFYRLWQGKRGQGMTEFYCQVLDDIDGYKFSLFHSGDEYFFVQEVGKKNVRRISAMYKGFANARIRKQKMDINWIVVEQIKT